LSIPAKFREALASHRGKAARRKKAAAGAPELKLILTNLDGCIVAYSENEWEEVQGRIERSGVTKKEAKNFLRFFYSGVSECPIDRLGRMLIPQSLRNYGAIRKNVVIVGMNRKIEIWAEEAWTELVKRATSDMEKLTDIASELGL
ncbi:MAG: division/cell wall cluster transcriptional repressor MraZ, partial [Syntrophorhabdales bacterium]